MPLEQIRFAGLRLQRGGVGFYPTSGSPFVHLDTGSIRHWPRMNHDQLVKLFPDGRTVHIPSDGTPLKGYELARAEIEKRDGGDGALTKSSPSLWAALFKTRSNDDEDEGVSAPPPAADQVAAARSADPVPTPRAKPRAAATLQLASADARIVRPVNSTPIAPPPAENSEARPQTPADIINARGFWGEAPAAPKQATPAQVAAIGAREAVAAADQQPTASISAAFQALAYAPDASSPAGHPAVVAASAPIPHRPAPGCP